MVLLGIFFTIFIFIFTFALIACFLALRTLACGLVVLCLLALLG